MRQTALIGIAALLAIGTWTVAGCSDSTDPEPAGTGSLRIALTDAPGDYDEVNVEVIGVEVHRSGEAGGWMAVDVDTTAVDLLTLTDGQSVVLADSVLPTGAYTQIRLVLGEGNTVVVDGETHELVVPSGGETGLKLNHPFSIEPETLYALTLDFDADRSVHATNDGYKLRPVIRVIVDAISGAVAGTVEPAAAEARIWTVAGPDTVATYADASTGEFAFTRLEEGSYDLHVEATAGAYVDALLEAVAVAAGETTQVGTVTLDAE
jgi:hypothetical protein